MRRLTRGSWIAVATVACIVLGAAHWLGVMRRNSREAMLSAEMNKKRILAEAIELYRTDHKKLPPTLQDLFKPRPGLSQSDYVVDGCYFRDAEGNPITYRIVDGTNYILSAPVWDSLIKRH